ncbi:hypothetical protein ACFOSS_05960 [Pseudaeromonas sharmana]|uniref:Uncharacterized protein n=1 Tax=Pseudaeromonas sharmana TaxID=328412 RepID=A0ABV8CLY6_9GAMM
MWLGYWGRLKAYAWLAVSVFVLLMLQSPIGSPGGWLAALLLIGIAVWWELADYPES